jgi:hypothetical protein
VVLKADAVICTSCGTDFRTGGTLKTATTAKASEVDKPLRVVAFGLMQSFWAIVLTMLFVPISLVDADLGQWAYTIGSIATILGTILCLAVPKATGARRDIIL